MSGPEGTVQYTVVTWWLRRDQWRAVTPARYPERKWFFFYTLKKRIFFNPYLCGRFGLRRLKENKVRTFTYGSVISLIKEYQRGTDKIKICVYFENFLKWQYNTVQNMLRQLFWVRLGRVHCTVGWSVNFFWNGQK